MSDETPKVVWQAESTHPDLADTLKESLREVIDPELHLNIIELGLVRDVEINDGGANINMILTTPFCPYGPAMLESTRKKAKDTLNREVKIEMGTEMWDPSMMEEGAGGDWGMW